MPAKFVTNGLVAATFAILGGCGSQSATQQSGPDPIQQEIEAKVKQKGSANKEIPPGYMMNSGGELVPVSDQSDQSDQ